MNDDLMLENQSEIEIFRQFSKNRRIFVYGYTSKNLLILLYFIRIERQFGSLYEFQNIFSAVLYGAGVFYILLPISTRIANQVSPKNVTPSHYILYPAIYFVDDEKYYYFILLHQSICFYVSTTVVLATDTLYVILVEHVCGMFNILR